MKSRCITLLWMDSSWENFLLYNFSYFQNLFYKLFRFQFLVGAAFQQPASDAGKVLKMTRATVATKFNQASTFMQVWFNASTLFLFKTFDLKRLISNVRGFSKTPNQTFLCTRRYLESFNEKARSQPPYKLSFQANEREGDGEYLQHLPFCFIRLDYGQIFSPSNTLKWCRNSWK